MKAPGRFPLLSILSPGLLLAITGSVLGATEPPTGTTVRDIEQFHGTAKVVPAGLREPVEPVVERPRNSFLPSRPTPVTAALVETLHAVRDGSKKVTSAAADCLTKITERLKITHELRPVYITNYPYVPYASAPAIATRERPVPSLPQAPWLTPTTRLATPAAHTDAPPAAAPAATPVAATQPTVVVVREPAGEIQARPPVTPVAEPDGITISVGTLLAGLSLLVLIAGLVIGIGYAVVRQAVVRRRDAPPALAVPAAPVASDGLLLMGKYNAGPPRGTAERFEIGNSYQAEQAEKRKARAEQQEALVAFILSQNLALHDQIAGEAGTAGTPPAAAQEPEPTTA